MKKYFECKNKQTYALEVTLASTENNNEPNTVMLDNENIGLFRYVNEINNLCPTATIDYIDKIQTIDRFVGKQYVVCSVVLTHSILKQCGNVKVRTDKDPEKFMQGFFVNNIEILNRDGTEITYRLHLMSTMWMNLMKTVKYTNYGEAESKSLMCILKAICKSNEIPIDCESWSKCKSTSSFKYISGNNDNFFTCFKYLMNKSFFNQKNTMDGALKGIVYNDYMDKLCMFDFTNDFKYQGLVNVNISMMKNKTFDIEGSDEVNIACVLNKTNSEKMEGLFPTILYSYNFQTNEIENESTCTRVIAAYCSGASTSNESIIPMYDGNKYTKDYSLWDNNMNLYTSSFSSVKDYNGLIVNIEGAMNVNPGWKAAVNIRGAQEEGWQNHPCCRYMKKVQDNYRQFEGGWYVSKVVYLVNPMKGMFRQNLSLMRTENMVP